MPPPCLTVTAGAVPAAEAFGVSAAAVRATLLRLPKIHSAMYAKKARV